MDLYILNTNFEIIASIDEYESVLWEKKFNDTGSCEIYIGCTQELLDLLQVDYYIFRYDDDMVCRINKRVIDTSITNGDYLTITAIDVCDILSGRIVWSLINFTGKVVDLIERILNENVIDPGINYSNRKIPNFSVDTSNFDKFTDTISIQLNYENEVLTTIKELCQAYDYGFRLTYDLNNGFVFKLYKGEDKSSPTNDEYIEFSNEYGNILDTNYEENKENYKTVVRVGGVEADDGSRLFVNLNRAGENVGLKRQELFVDGSSVKNTMDLADIQLLYPNGTVSGTQYILNDKVVANKDSSGDKYTLTDEYYSPLLVSYGKSILTNYNKSYYFEGDIDMIDTYDYKIDYNLGDKVKVINNYGISASAEITEVLESDDIENGYAVEPKFTYEGVDK